MSEKDESEEWKKKYEMHDNADEEKKNEKNYATELRQLFLWVSLMFAAIFML